MQKHMILSLTHISLVSNQGNAIFDYCDSGTLLKRDTTLEIPAHRLPDVGLDMEAAAGFRFLLMSLEHGGPRCTFACL